MIPSAINSATAGIQRNLEILDEAAARIAEQPLDSDLPRDIVDMKMAKHGVAANAAVLKAADEMTGQIIDLLA